MEIFASPSFRAQSYSTLKSARRPRTCPGRLRLQEMNEIMINFSRRDEKHSTIVRGSVCYYGERAESAWRALMQSTATLILNEQHISNIFRRKRAELFNRNENDVMKLAKTGCEKNPRTHFRKHPERDRNFRGCFRYFKIVQPTLQCHLLLFVFPASRTRNKRSLIKSLLLVSVF